MELHLADPLVLPTDNLAYSVGHYVVGAYVYAGGVSLWWWHYDLFPRSSRGKCHLSHAEYKHRSVELLSLFLLDIAPPPGWPYTTT